MKVNIYSPTYYRHHDAARFIESMKASIERSNYDVKLFIADNNSPKDMKDYLMGQNDEHTQVHLFEKNYGKGHAVNTLHNNVRKSDVVFSIDSDIVCLNDMNWIDKMADITRDPRVGIVSARFQDGVAHGYSSLKKSINICGSKLVYGSNIIGGACIALRSNLWNSIGGYNAPDIYAGDDGTMISNVLYKQKQIVGVCMDVELFHLEDEDPKYRAWKVSHMKNRKLHNKKPNTGYFENNGGNAT